MGVPTYEKNKIEPIFSDPSEAAKEFISAFSDLQEGIKKLKAEPPSEKYHTDEDQAMAEDDAERFQIEKIEDDFADSWREDVAPEIKKDTIAKLLELGREDVVMQIGRFSDVSSLVDEETLKRIRK